MKHATQHPSHSKHETDMEEDEEKENEIFPAIDYSDLTEERGFNAWIATCKNFSIFAKVVILDSV